MPDPEALAREEIDRQLALAGWTVQDRTAINLFAGPGVAIREVSIPGAGETDYLLVAGQRAVGIVEAKPRGTTLTGVELQTRVYASDLPPHMKAWTLPLPMLYESTGTETRFTNLLEPEPRSRHTFGFHRPQTLMEWAKLGAASTPEPPQPRGIGEGLAPYTTGESTLAGRLKSLPLSLDDPALWPAQRTAITNLEQSLRDNRPRARLKRYRAAVLKAACEGKLVPTEAELARSQSRDYEPASVLLERIRTERVANPGPKRGKPKPIPAPETASLPNLPEGWAWTTLDQISERIGDVDHRMPKAQDTGIPYVSTKDFRSGDSIDFVNAKRISREDFKSLSRKIVPEQGDILLSRYGTVGEVRVVTTDIPFQASYSIAIIKMRDVTNYTRFIATYLTRCACFRNQVHGSFTMGGDEPLTRGGAPWTWRHLL